MKREETTFGGSAMQDLFGSVRRSFVGRPNPSAEERSNGGGVSRIAEKIGSCLRKSRVGLDIGLGLGFLPKSLTPPRRIASTAAAEVEAPQIRWRKGELIGCGAFGHVYMGMNLDSGELIAIKQVLIGASNASKAKAQAHIRELEEEVKLLKNLSHPNIVRYLGTAREEETLNILLEFVPGGSISSLLGKFGSFPEAGANILVDNKGCIKLADFGASKQVAKLATMTAAKSMKGTPYWMAPEVIVQSGHSFSADIWSVGCTVIEMATGKPPWSQQYQEVAALFHVGTTKSHPPIPEHLSLEAKDFLLKCLQEEPSLRPTASDLLQHPFVTGEIEDPHQSSHAMKKLLELWGLCIPSNLFNGLNNDNCDHCSCSTMKSNNVLRAGPIWDSMNNDDMCQFADADDFPVVGSSFNPMSEPFDEWPCNLKISAEIKMSQKDFGELLNGAPNGGKDRENEFTFPCDSMCDDDDEVTESKIRAFLDEKALDLKKLQTPLYEFYNTLNATNSRCVTSICNENIMANSKLPPKCKSSPKKVVSGTSTPQSDNENNNNLSPGSCSMRASVSTLENSRILREIASPEWGDSLQDAKQEPTSASVSASEKERKWKEELDMELERGRVRSVLNLSTEMRQAGLGKTSSPKEKGPNRKRDRQRFTSPT
ncbi:Mitogen-activated protein kinase kinase kinase NPK1, partial [Ananas comosus]